MKIYLASALLGLFNMGQSAPSPDSHAFFLAKSKKYTDRTIEGTDFPSIGAAVIAVCGDICESDEHVELFTEEAQGFYEDLKTKSLDRVIHEHPSLKPYKEILQ